MGQQLLTLFVAIGASVQTNYKQNIDLWKSQHRYITRTTSWTASYLTICLIDRGAQQSLLIGKHVAGKLDLMPS